MGNLALRFGILRGTKKFDPVHGVVIYSEKRGIALLIHHIGTRWT